MLSYLKYMVSVPRKFILTLGCISSTYISQFLPLAFANESVEGLLIDTQKEAFRGMSENDTIMNIFGISDWDNVFTLEGMVTTYFLSLFGVVMVAFATIVLLNKLGAKAEEDGTFEFVASLPMTRGTVYLTHSVVAIFFGLFIAFAWTNVMYIPIATMELSTDARLCPFNERQH